MTLLHIPASAAQGIWARRAQYAPVAALVGAVVLWSSSFVGMKLALRELAPLSVIWLRLAFAMAVIVPVIWPKLRPVAHREGRGAFSRYQRGDALWLLVVALFLPCLYFTLESYALRYTSASAAGTISALMPLMVAVAATVFLQERLSLSMVGGLLLSCIGVGWLTYAGTPSEHGPMPLLGNALECAAMAAAAGYTLGVRKLSGRYDPWVLAGVQNSMGLVWFLPGMLLSGIPDVSLGSAVWPNIWPNLLAVVYLGVAVSLGAFWCYSYALAQVTAARASAYVNMVPVVTLLLSWLVLDEQLSGWQYAGCAVVLAGVCLSQGIFGGTRR